MQNQRSKHEDSKYNKIFEKLVIEAEDRQAQLIGMLAYAEYKIKKHKWVQRNPNYTPEEINAFLGIFDEEELEKLKYDAARSLEDFNIEYTNQVIDEMIEQYKKDVLSSFFTETENKISQLIEQSTKWWKSILYGVLASVIFSILLILTAVTIRSAAPESNFGKLVQFVVSPEQYQIELIKLESKPTEE